MLKKAGIIFVFGLVILLFIGSCAKEYSCEGCRSSNQPPVAVAGPDRLIYLPTDSVLLDGRSSDDPDGTIDKWSWKKISGPVSFVLEHAEDSLAILKSLSIGTYSIELTVTDNLGATASDTVSIQVNAALFVNRPPVANAGPDQTLTLPISEVWLDGSASSDPDNNIAGYFWSRISSPGQGDLTDPKAIRPKLTNLVEGIYSYELEVTDSGGLTSRDTTIVAIRSQDLACGDPNRPQLIAKLTPVGVLSKARAFMSVGSLGNKIFFAGGLVRNDGFSKPESRVDIYDTDQQAWTTAELSLGRIEMAVAASGSKIFFAGGRSIIDVAFPTSGVSNLDVFDAATGNWSQEWLNKPGIHLAAAAISDKLIIAGDRGNIPASAEVYDLTGKTWSTFPLNKDRTGQGISVVARDNKVYIAGGSVGGGGTFITSDEIDIYDGSSGLWTRSAMLEGKAYFAGVSHGDNIYWGGGYTDKGGELSVSCRVDVMNIRNGTHSTMTFSRPAIGAWLNPVLIKDNKIIFQCLDPLSATNYWWFEIYDITNDTWSTGQLPIDLSAASFIAIDDTIYVAGGYLSDGSPSNQVWKMEF